MCAPAVCQNGNLPLHVAAMHQQGGAVVSLLLDAYREGAKEKNAPRSYDSNGALIVMSPHETVAGNALHLYPPSDFLECPLIFSSLLP